MSLLVKGINQYYGGSHILRDVSLKAESGKITVLLGRNGVGKTTLLKSLMGLVPIRTGGIEFNGVPIRRHQLITFVIAGFFGGIAGSLYAFFSGTISPQIADWTASARPFLANTMGGVHSFWGPIFGVLTLETIGTQVGRFTEHSAIAVGLLAIGVGVFLPRGIVGLAQDLPGWLRRRRGEG
jgi:ABC-type cobalamin/Fe3+-siderophores transport system ATPase subunit